jgi:hypothetical protein
MTSPFLYAAAAHVRRHGPRGYADYASYRPWLRDECTFRCVYCLLREQGGLVRGVFAIDHFLPVAVHPEKAADYENLVYGCVGCNLAKGSQQIPDPCRVLLRDDVRVLANGTIQGRTTESRLLIRLLRLDDAAYTEFRSLWISIVSLAARHAPELYQRLLGFPEDLPDLRKLQPPEGNSRPEGVEESYLVQRERGTLPSTY